METKILKVVNLDRYTSYRELIVPLMKAHKDYCDRIEKVLDCKDPIVVYNTSILPTTDVPNQAHLDFSRVSYLQRSFENYNIGAVYLDSLFALGERDLCRAFKVQVIIYEGSFNYVKVFLNYSDLSLCSPKRYIRSDNGMVARANIPEGSNLEKFLVVCRSMSKGRNILFEQDEIGKWILRDLKKNISYSEGIMTSAFIGAANALIKSYKNPIGHIYCIFDYSVQGKFNREISVTEVNGELEIVFYYGTSL